MNSFLRVRVRRETNHLQPARHNEQYILRAIESIHEKPDVIKYVFRGAYSLMEAIMHCNCGILL